MNVSPEIMRMLGASEEAIAAKEAEISGVKWVAPTQTGLEHSAAIADCDDVALGGGKSGQSSVKRVFSEVGKYDTPAQENTSSSAPTGAALTSGAGGSAAGEENGVLKVKIMHAPQPVPKKLESKLPPATDVFSDSDSGSDTSWDEVSVIDGHAWWETGSDEVGLCCTICRNRICPPCDYL